MKLPASDVAIVLGSGLSTVAARLAPGEPIPYSQLDGFPVSGVPGHEGSLRVGENSGHRVLVFGGRVHMYEGHDAETVVIPVRQAIAAGCGTIILTNAAGSIPEWLRAGDLCLISDHLNLTGSNPLRGPEPDPTWRFIDMVDAYDPRLRALAREVDPNLKEGVYAGLPGPTYETPAEVKMLRTLGADMVGMSTVLETIAARHMGAKVLGFSVITNKAAGLTGDPVTHEEVMEMGKNVGERLGNVIQGVLERL
jgi:purine-nucleoside phosphorylase